MGPVTDISLSDGLPPSWNANVHEIRGLRFWIGSLYEIFTGRRPYEELYALDLSHREEVDRLFAQKQFPSVDGLGDAGKIILNCWTMGYPTFKVVKADLNKACLKVL